MDIAALALQALSAPVKGETLSVSYRGTAIRIQDVLSTQWFFPFVRFLLAAGLAQGKSDAGGVPTALFAPAMPVTHAEAIKMLLLATKVDMTKVSEHPDEYLAKGQWFSSYFKAAEDRKWRLLTTSLNGNGFATRGPSHGTWSTHSRFRRRPLRPLLRPAGQSPVRLRHQHVGLPSAS